MEYRSEKSPSTTNQITPRIIIHGGAGNITRSNLSPEAYAEYRTALLSILASANSKLSKPDATALDVATYAVTLLESNPLFNCGHGAVYTTAGTQELEASVMVSRGYQKRGVGVMKLNHVKHPILLAREMLIMGNEANGGGAHSHVQLHGESAEALAKKWGLEMCRPSHFWTKRRWDEHRRGLGLSTDWDSYERDRRGADGGMIGDAGVTAASNPSWDTGSSWDGKEYLPQGTVGCVVLDSDGVICVATSTGGITNKLPGRIGDTPTLGAGFWSEEWQDDKWTSEQVSLAGQQLLSPLNQLMNFGARNMLADCLPIISGYTTLPANETADYDQSQISSSDKRHAVGMSGTGNGDSFLRLAAARTAAAMTRFKDSSPSLQSSVSAMAGPGGMLQQSAGDRWHKTGEGEGGIIGIELKHGKGRIVADFNCGGMFRTWIDDDGKAQMMILREEY